MESNHPPERLSTDKDRGFRYWASKLIRKACGDEETMIAESNADESGDMIASRSAGDRENEGVTPELISMAKDVIIEDHLRRGLYTPGERYGGITKTMALNFTPLTQIVSKNDIKDYLERERAKNRIPYKRSNE